MSATTPAWRLSTLEFRLLWLDAHGAAFPGEFCPFGHEVYDNADHQRSVEVSTLQKLTPSVTPAMRAALEALTAPRYTIGVLGLDARAPLRDTAQHLRVVSSWGGSGEHVVVARQLPGPTPSHGGDVLVTRHQLAGWARDLVEMLPRSSGAGRLAADDDVPFDEIPIDVEVLRQVSPNASKDTAAGVFVHKSPTTCGSIRVQVGSEVDGRRPAAMTLQYRDIEGDGRYLLIIDSPGTALGVDDAKMASTINRAVNSMKKQYEARANAGWE